MLRPALAALLLALAAPAGAQTAGPSAAPPAAEAPEEVRALFDALRLPEVVAIISREGIADGEELAQGIFGPGPVPAAWGEAIAAIYDAPHLESAMLADLARALEGQDVAAMTAFFATEPGASLVAREVETRAALSDSEAEEEAREEAAVAMAAENPRLELLRRYVEALDLVEFNVVGAMNSNFAYVAALLDGGALRPDMTEEDLLSDISAQEGQIRADTSEWVYSFLLRAYDGAPDSDLEALIAFSESDLGQALNRAIFDAFDARFTEISRNLGLAAARYMTTEEL